MILIETILPPMAKARPRLSGGHVHMPAEYMKWKKDLILAAGIKNKQPPLDCPFCLSVRFYRKTGKMRPDLDNAVGSILDAMQDGQLIKNDRLCTAITAEIIKSKTNYIRVLATEI